MEYFIKEKIALKELATIGYCLPKNLLCDKELKNESKNN